MSHPQPTLKMNLYRVIVILEVEAMDEDHACRFAEQECSQSAFMGCQAVYEIAYPKE